MTTDIQADLAAICKLLDGRTVKCPNLRSRAPGEKTAHHEDESFGVCSCNGTGRVPDPQYDALRKVLSEYAVAAVYGVVRFWANMPGALAGVLFCAATPLEIEGFDLSIFASANPDAAAAQVVREALEDKP